MGSLLRYFENFTKFFICIVPQNDLFEKAKDDILDDIAALHKSTPLEWETLLQENLWEKIHPKVVDDIYLGAAECTTSSNFNTKVREFCVPCRQ